LVVLPRPDTPDRIEHQVATSEGWTDSVELGPLSIGAVKDFKDCVPPPDLGDVSWLLG